MISTRNVLILSVLINSLATTASADFIGLKLGASNWAPELTGTFSSGNTTIDLVGELGLDDPSSSSLQLILEHPIPILPNIKYQNFELDSAGSSNILPADAISFEGESYSGTVTSTFDLTHDDIVLYYEILDNWINLDIGIDLKRFDGEIALSDDSGATPTSVLIDETIPLFYLSARFDLPFSGFYIGADINSISIGDSSAEDSTIKLGYISESGIGIEGGYKKFSLKLDDANNIDTNLEYDGVYLNGYINF
ncbi:MAG: TIGR04219 family outer membrane beta-barrel protein [Gammaproteobacteria bacterium]